MNGPTYARVHASLDDNVGHDIAWLEVPRDAVEHASEATQAAFKSVVDQVVARCVKTSGLIRISITICGYDKDSRELFEIPEVCTWAKATLDLIPGLWMLLDKSSQTHLTVWSFGPVSREEMESSAFQARCANQQTIYATVGGLAFAALLMRAGAGNDLVKGLSAEAALGLAR